MSQELTANHLEGPTSYPALLADYIESGHCRYNITAHQFRFWNGSIITLSHLQQERDLSRQLGKEFSVLLIDELTTFPITYYNFLRSRVRMANKHDLPEKYKDCFPRIVCSSNPGSISHQQVKGMFIDSATEGEIWTTPEDQGRMKRQYIRSTIYDNKYLLDSDPTYIDRLKGLGNKEMVKAYLLGEWDILAGSMFDDIFDRKIHVLDRDWMSHNTEAKVKNKFTRSFDWGWSAPFAVLWFMELTEDYTGRTGKAGEDNWERTFKKGSIICFDEYYGTSGEPNKGVRFSPSQIAEGIRTIEARMEWTIQSGSADRSIWNTDTNIASEMATAGIHWIPSDKSPGSRARGWQRLREYFQNALQSPPEGPGLYITANCSNLLRTLPLAERDKGNPDDIDSHIEDHLLDTLRYKILEIPRKITTQKVIGF